MIKSADHFASDAALSSNCTQVKTWGRKRVSADTMEQALSWLWRWPAAMAKVVPLVLVLRRVLGA